MSWGVIRALGDHIGISPRRLMMCGVVGVDIFVAVWNAVSNLLYTGSSASSVSFWASSNNFFIRDGSLFWL